MVLCFINKRRAKDVFDRVRYGEVEGQSGGYLFRPMLKHPFPPEVPAI